MSFSRDMDEAMRAEWVAHFGMQAGERGSMMIRAKMRCNQVETPYPGTQIVRMAPVYDSDPNGANHDWSAATPAGNLELYISNPGAQGKIEQGREYFVDISPA